MRIGYNLKRAVDLARGLAVHRQLQSHDRWSFADIQALQCRQLSSLVEHAVTHSRLYRNMYGSLRNPAAVRLEELPILTKAELMDNFDDWVCDPRLNLNDIQAHLAELRRDELYLGEYRAMATAGSTGRRGVFVFNRREWSTVVAATLRVGSLMDVKPRFPKRVKMAAIGAASPRHMTYRVVVSADIGLYRILRLEITEPVDELVAALNDFGPEWLHSYSSVAALLAHEQLAGRLRIAPRVVSTSSEVLAPEMREAIQAAWGVEPFNYYGMTEVGMFGVECTEHLGIHVFEDTLIFEVVDERGEPVPDGEMGHKLLITNLFNHTQPLIRCEVGDMVTVSPEPCPCGRPLRLLKAIEGRSDDILYVADGLGGHVPVHPLHLRSVLGAEGEVRQYQVVQRVDEISLRIVPSEDAQLEQLTARLEDGLRGSLKAAGAEPPPIRIEYVPALEREPGMGKLKLVVSETSLPER